MGRIKTKKVKAATENIVNDNRERFTKDFEANKKAVQETTDVSSKKLRNVIAGYITRKMKASE